MNKRIYLGLVSICLLLALFVFTGCSDNKSSDSISGTWYYIQEFNEDSSYNLVFKGDKVNYDHLNFDYTQNGKEIDIDLTIDVSMGPSEGKIGLDDVEIGKKELVVESFESFEAIAVKGEDKPTWAKSLEDAKALYNIYYKNGDSVDDENKQFDETEAQENGGFYIKKDDQYYPLLLVAPDKEDERYLYFTEPNEGMEIPEFNKDDKIVLFSDNDPTYSRWIITKVNEPIYTIPVYFLETRFDEDDVSYYFHDIFLQSYLDSNSEDTEDGYEEDDEYYDDGTNDQEDEDLYVDDIESFNGKSIQELFESDCLNEFKIEDYKDGGILKCDKGEKVTLGYHSGTAYNELVCQAESRVFFKNGKTKEIEAELGETSYATFQLPELSEGLYVIEGPHDYIVFRVN